MHMNYARKHNKQTRINYYTTTVAIYNVIFIDVYWYVYFVAFIVVLYVDNVNISIYIYIQTILRFIWTYSYKTTIKTPKPYTIQHNTTIIHQYIYNISII